MNARESCARHDRTRDARHYRTSCPPRARNQPRAQHQPAVRDCRRRGDAPPHAPGSPSEASSSGAAAAGSRARHAANWHAAFDIGNAPSDAPPLSYGLAVHGSYLYYTDAARGVLARCSCGARAVLARCSRGARSTSSDQVRTRRSVVFVIFSTGRQFACLLFARLLACSPLCEEDRHCQRPRGADAHAVWRLWPPPSSRASYVCVLRVVLFSSFVILSF